MVVLNNLTNPDELRVNRFHDVQIDRAKGQRHRAILDTQVKRRGVFAKSIQPHGAGGYEPNNWLAGWKGSK